MWEDSHAKFLDQLVRDRVDVLLNDNELLKNLRYDNKRVKWWLKWGGYVFEEKGLNLYEEIARACGEIQEDSEDPTAQPRIPPRRAGSTRTGMSVDGACDGV